MNVLDLAVILFLIIGGYRGYKYGMFSSILALIGTVVIFVIAYYLKNPVSELMYTYLPFRDYGGLFTGVSSFNILVYEGFAYVVVMLILAVIFRFVLSVTGILDKFLKMTMVLALPSKFIGIIFGAIEWFLFAFIGIYICAQIPVTTKYVKESDIAKPILEHTPLLSGITDDIYHAVSDVYDVCLLHEGYKAEHQLADYETLDVLLKYDIISVPTAKKLVANGKLTISNTEPLFARYEGKTNVAKEAADKIADKVTDEINNQMNKDTN